MLKRDAEKTISGYLALGSFVITILVFTGSVTDPVNVTKFVPLGMLAIGILMVLARDKFSVILTQFKITAALCTVFLLASINSLIQSSAPISQSLYGVYGRNNGFLTYLFLLILLIGSLCLSQKTSFEKLQIGLLAASAVNLVYCLWVILFGDFMGWSNPYGNILGTFGNPNFVGAFLGMTAVAFLATALDSKRSMKIRLIIFAIVLLGIFEVFNSHALQGQVLLVAGFGYVGFLLVYHRKKIYGYLFLVVGVTLSILGVLGTQQIGPFSSYLYKTSVTLRGQYWLAGWNMGNSHPFSGVGFDSYGDWYRVARDIKALTSPGVNTVSNSSHNVFLDIFAFGGWPLFLSYVALVLMAGVSVIQVISRSKKFDSIFAALSSSWLCYQLQSIISINQIGLAIWGWILSGALIAYNEVQKQEALSISQQEKKSNTRNVKQNVFSSTLLGAIGMVIGLLIALPPLNSDIQWKKAQASRSLVEFEKSLQPEYLNPQNSFKYASSVSILEQSGLKDKSLQYALSAVKFNPNSFDAWRTLYFISGSNAEEKNLALTNLKRLDPLNSDVTKP
jgi:hypothetical protein